MSASFRYAALQDVDRLLEMMRTLYAHDGIPFDEQKSRKAIDELITPVDCAFNAFGRIWLIESEGAVAGYMVLTFGFSIEYGGVHGFLDELFVADSFRGLGLGSAAIEHASALCRSLGLTVILLEVAFENTRAHALYERLGFREHGRRLMSRLLTAPQHAPAATLSD